MKIVLDTNVFYVYMGISQDTHFKQDRFVKLVSDTNNLVVISTVTIYEFFLKYQNNIHKIHEGISFVAKNIDQIYKLDNIFPLEEEIQSMLKMSDDQIRDMVGIYRERKIEIESRFSVLFLGFLLFQYTLSYLLEKQTDGDETLRILDLAKKYLPLTLKKVFENYTKALSDAYLIDKQKKVATDNFNSMLINELLSWILFLEFISTNPRSDLSDEELFCEFSRLIDSNSHTKNFYRHEDNINEWIAKYDQVNKQIASNALLSDWRLAFEHRKMSKTMIDYMEWKLSNLGQQKLGQRTPKFRKNDVLDMLILPVLDDEDTILITFDTDLRKFLLSINNKSENYITSVYSIPLHF